ncbi:MAG: hypothetical protein A2Z96_07530 [Spirochaetes bacterium GWB1_48_6]|nr:MAG: hypothetical protein A2Z96_07530 [Spirochaetes bacterium GWB1_48_6]
MKQRIIAFFNLLHIGMVYLSKLMMVAMVLITFVNVVLRYGFNSGLIWSEEVSLLLDVWFIFVAMSLGVKQDLHINLSLIAEHRMTERIDRVLTIIRGVVYLVIGLAMLVYGWKLAAMTMSSIMPATKWPAGLLYGILPISAIVIIYEAIADLFHFDTKDLAVDRYLSGETGIKDVIGAADVRP